MTSPRTAPHRPTAPPRSPPVVRLWLAVLGGYLAFGATLQALPGYVAARFSGGELAAGWAVGIAFAATAICRPWSGRAGDAGYSRPVVISGGALIALGGAGHLLAPALWVLLVARVVMGAGEAALFSAALPWVIAGIPAERRGRVTGWFGLSMWGGLAAGPLVAVGATAVGPTAVWWAVLGLGIVVVVLVTATRPPDRGAEVALRPRSWRDVLPPGAALPGLGFGLAATGYGAVTTLLVLHLRAGGHGGQDVALAVFAAAFLLARAVGSPQVDRFGGPRVAVVALVVEAVGLAAIAFSANPAVALPATALAGVGLSLMLPATVVMTLARSGPLRPGTSVGTMTSFWDLGILVAGPVSGAVAAHAGVPVAFGVAAVASLAAVGVPVAVARAGR